MRCLFLIPLVFYLAFAAVVAQPHGWACDYGYRPGNTWYYRSASLQGGIYSQTVVRDSVGADGDYWVYIASSALRAEYWYRIDSTGMFREYIQPAWKWVQDRFIATADFGDWWVVDTLTTQAPLLARIDRIYRDRIFDKEFHTSKDVVFYISDDLGEYWQFSELWTEGIGVTRRRFHDGGDDYIVGAIIDGVSYGSATSVDDIGSSEAKRLAVYPLPASGNATLMLTAHGGGRAVVAIHDVLGRLLHRERLDALNDGVNTIPLDLTELASGSYRIAVDCDGARYTTPLVIAR